MTAHGKSETTEEATLYIIDLDSNATVMLLNNYLAVLWLRQLCEKMNFSNVWKQGGLPQ